MAPFCNTSTVVLKHSRQLLCQDLPCVWQTPFFFIFPLSLVTHFFWALIKCHLLSEFFLNTLFYIAFLTLKSYILIASCLIFLHKYILLFDSPSITHLFICKLYFLEFKVCDSRWSVYFVYCWIQEPEIQQAFKWYMLSKWIGVLNLPYLTH